MIHLRFERFSQGIGKKALISFRRLLGSMPSQNLPFGAGLTVNNSNEAGNLVILIDSLTSLIRRDKKSTLVAFEGSSGFIPRDNSPTFHGEPSLSDEQGNTIPASYHRGLVSLTSLSALGYRWERQG